MTVHVTKLAIQLLEYHREKAYVTGMATTDNGLKDLACPVERGTGGSARAFNATQEAQWKAFTSRIHLRAWSRSKGDGFAITSFFILARPPLHDLVCYESEKQRRRRTRRSLTSSILAWRLFLRSRVVYGDTVFYVFAALCKLGNTS